MTITLHQDVASIVAKTAGDYGITSEQAANFLIRFSTLDKPGPALSEILILDERGDRCYRYPMSSTEAQLQENALTGSDY